jgi:hypothetical protein
MALAAEEATFNAAVDTLLAAWEVLNDHFSADEKIQIVKLKARSTNASADRLGVDSAQEYDFGKKFIGFNTPDVADSFKISVGGSGPLFFKVTNDANELT